MRPWLTTVSPWSPEAMRFLLAYRRWRSYCRDRPGWPRWPHRRSIRLAEPPMLPTSGRPGRLRRPGPELGALASGVADESGYEAPGDRRRGHESWGRRDDLPAAAPGGHPTTGPLPNHTPGLW